MRFQIAECRSAELSGKGICNSAIFQSELCNLKSEIRRTCQRYQALPFRVQPSGGVLGMEPEPGCRRHLRRPGTAIYVGYNSDLANLNRGLAVDPVTGFILTTPNGYINDSRQFFVKASYLYRF